MFEVDSLVTYRSRSGKVQARVVSVIPDIDRTYYALKVTSKSHSQYAKHTEILVPVDSDDLVYKRLSKRRVGNFKTHCVNEHEFTPENTYFEKEPGRENIRHCLKCQRINNARYYQKRAHGEAQD